MIKIIDMRKYKIKYIKSKIREDRYRLVNAEARVVFKAGVTIGILKCISRFNHIGAWSKMLNLRYIDSCCLRCIEEET